MTGDEAEISTSLCDLLENAARHAAGAHGAKRGVVWSTNEQVVSWTEHLRSVAQQLTRPRVCLLARSDER